MTTNQVVMQSVSKFYKPNPVFHFIMTFMPFTSWQSWIWRFLHDYYAI